MVAGGEGFPPGVEGDFVRAHQRVRAAAGRVAVGAALFIAEVADTPGGELLDRVWLHALDFEEGPLDAASAHGVLAERAVGAHHAVAGDQEGHGVLAERRSDRADRFGVPDLAGDPAVWPHLAARDLQSLEQHGALELGQAAQIELELRAVPALQVLHERSDGRRGARRRLRDRTPPLTLEAP